MERRRKFTGVPEFDVISIPLPQLSGQEFDVTALALAWRSSVRIRRVSTPKPSALAKMGAPPMSQLKRRFLPAVTVHDGYLTPKRANPGQQTGANPSNISWNGGMRRLTHVFAKFASAEVPCCCGGS